MIFRTTAERERLARVITSNLLLKQSSATQRAAYQPQPLVMEKTTLQALTMLPVEDVACALHEYYVSVCPLLVLFFFFLFVSFFSFFFSLLALRDFD